MPGRWTCFAQTIFITAICLSYLVVQFSKMSVGNIHFCRGCWTKPSSATKKIQEGTGTGHSHETYRHVDTLWKQQSAGQSQGL